MFADIELIGIPHRVVVSERGLAAGTLEYRAREDSESRALSQEELTMEEFKKNEKGENKSDTITESTSNKLY